MKQESGRLDALHATVDLAGEFLVPGGSNLIEGNYLQGAIHAVLGLLAKSVFGLPGLILVSANSFTKASTGRHIHQHLGLGTSLCGKENLQGGAAAPVQPAAREGPRTIPPSVSKAPRKRTPSSRRKKET
jgi:hypothetical protein